MTIKKNTQAAAPTPATGGATIADRFKLNAPDPNAKAEGMVSKSSSLAALIVGLIALHVTVILAYTLFRHWEFLINA